MQKKTLSTALGFQPRSFDCRLTALTTELHRHPTSNSPQEDLLISPSVIRRSSCGELDVVRLCSSVVRAVDRKSKDLGLNPSAVGSVFFSTERFSNSLKIFETEKFRIIQINEKICKLYKLNGFLF